MLSKSEETLLKGVLSRISESLSVDKPLNKRTCSTFKFRRFELQAYDLYQSGRYSEAKRFFHQLLISKPLKQGLWIGLGACLQMEGLYRESLRAWGMASILDGDDPAPHFYAAQCNFALDDLEQSQYALEASKRVLKSDNQMLSRKIAQLEHQLKSSTLKRGSTR